MKRVAILYAALSLAPLPSLAEVPSEWKGCEQEIARYCRTASESHAIFECIEKRERMGRKSGLSQACLETHEKMEGAEDEEHERGERGEGHERGEQDEGHERR